MENPVVSSAMFVAESAKHVKLGTDAEFEAAAKIITPLVKSWKPESWSDFELHPSELKSPEKKAAWIFLIDTMNYAFWTAKDQIPFTAAYKGKNWTGYWSLCASIKRGTEENEEILSPHFWAKATSEDWNRIFKSETETPIPFLEWRQKTISEAGKWLIEKYNGSVFEMLKSVKNSAVSLMELVRSNLESYRDQCTYHGKTVYFCKRAQILPADLHYAFYGENNEVADACKFTDIDKLTMFADYRVPQAINYLKLIHYDEFLLEKLNTDPYFPSGSELECEIRGCSIAAVEKVKKFVDFKGVNSVLIDFVLWPYAKEHQAELEHIPIHKTSSVFY